MAVPPEGLERLTEVSGALNELIDDAERGRRRVVADLEDATDDGRRVAESVVGRTARLFPFNVLGPTSVEAVGRAEKVGDLPTAGLRGRVSVREADSRPVDELEVRDEVDGREASEGSASTVR